MNFITKDEVLSYSKDFVGLSFEEIFSETLIGYDTEKPNKGALGNKVETVYGISPDSRRGMDFDVYNINLELKCTPIKTLKNGELRPADRLVIGMIDYNKIENTEYKNDLINKVQNMLVWSYLKVPGIDNGKYVVHDIFDMKISDDMMTQIKKDYKTIRDKVANGKAHLISGRDTVYLEACTKRSGGPENYFVEQPKSKTKAKSRAFSLKAKAMLEIYKYNKIISD